MSYTVAICTPPILADDEEAWKALDGLINAQGVIPPVFRVLHDQLTSKYPFPCDALDNEVDNDIRSDEPVWFEFGHRVAVLGIVYTQVEEVLPFLVKTANALGLTVFDQAGPTIFRPKSR